MHSVEQLIIEHDRMTALALDFCKIVKAARPDPNGATAIRAELSVLLEEHFSKESNFSYSTSMRRKNDVLDDAVESFEDEFDTLKRDWADYLAEWTMDVIASDWGYFRQQTILMMDRLTDRISRENALLVPLILKHSRIRLRAA